MTPAATIRHSRAITASARDASVWASSRSGTGPASALGAVSALLAGLYFAIVIGLQAAFSGFTRGNDLAIAGSTLRVAAPIGNVASASVMLYDASDPTGADWYDVVLREEQGRYADAQTIYRQILGFGDYGFPESHSASFALLVYSSAWLKCHHPAAFLAAMLNSQPMGFYGPSQLVQDARRHGVEARPADALMSEWDCTLEGGAVRLGLRMVKGLAEASGKRIIETRPHASVAQLAQRASLNRKDLKCLAAAGALQGLAGHRREARWAASGVADISKLLPPETSLENKVPFEPPAEGEEIVADYASLGLTLGRHPLALLRDDLSSRGFLDSGKIRGTPHGRRVRAAGLVTCRQRPDTATGVVFLTLEDESGCINVVVWRDLVERHRRELLGARLLGVEGVIERDGAVVHLVARRLEDRSALLARRLGNLEIASRDFH